jgi:hypothetical protein
MHLQCLAGWIQSKAKATCPLCRVELHRERAMRLCTEEDDEQDPIARLNHVEWLKAAGAAGRLERAAKLAREAAHRLAVERGEIIIPIPQDHPSNESDDDDEDEDFADTLARAREDTLRRRNARNATTTSTTQHDETSSDDEEVAQQEETLSVIRQHASSIRPSATADRSVGNIRLGSGNARSRRTLPIRADRSGHQGTQGSRNVLQRNNRALHAGPSTAAHQRPNNRNTQTRTSTVTPPVRNNRNSVEVNGAEEEPGQGRARGTERSTSPMAGRTASHRQRCITIRRTGQSSQASAMIAQNQNTIRPIYKGEMATVFPNDNRDQGGHSQNGVEGIVINDPTPPGYAIEVVTKHGIVGTSGTPSQTPAERYERAHSTQPLDARMGQLKRQVMGGTFNIARMRFISMRQLTRRPSNLEATGRPERQKCGCKHIPGATCASNQCGCRKSGQVCNARCKCRGNCNNT